MDSSYFKIYEEELVGTSTAFHTRNSRDWKQSRELVGTSASTEFDMRNAQGWKQSGSVLGEVCQNTKRQLKVKRNKKTSEYYEKITTKTQITKFVPHDKENYFPRLKPSTHSLENLHRVSPLAPLEILDNAGNEPSYHDDCRFSDDTKDNLVFQDTSLNEFTFNPVGENLDNFLSVPQNSKTVKDVTFDPIGEKNFINHILRVSDNSNDFLKFPFLPTQHGISSDNIPSINRHSKKSIQFTFDPTEQDTSSLDIPSVYQHSKRPNRSNFDPDDEDPSSDDILAINSKKTNQFSFDPTEEDPSSDDIFATNSKKTNQITFDPTEQELSCDDIFSVPDDSKRKNQLLFHPSGEDLSSDDMLTLPEYSKEIYEYLKGREISLLPLQDYMELQSDVTFSMRATVVDWLVEVAEEYKLNTQTIYLAVSYIDRFLSEMGVERSKLQLVGTASMMIAAKFQEIYPPHLKEFVFITDNSYSKQEVLQMERLVLQVLDFVVSAPTSHDFLTHYCRMFQVEDKTLHLALYINELSLLDGGTFLCFPPSLQAASSLVLSRHTLGLEAWSDDAAERVGYTLKDMRQCIVRLHRIFGEAPNLRHQAVREKYMHLEFSSVAKVCPVDIM